MSNDHHHHHDHASHSEMPFDEKMLKMLKHWIKHNEDHALNYRKWAKNAKTNDQEEAGALLEEAADMSLTINEKFEAAIAALSGN